MNLVDLTLVVFVALTVFVGIKRGFLISLLSALRFIIAVPLSLFVGNNYNVIIYNKVVRRYILEYVSKKLNDSSEITKFTENVKSFANTFSFFVKDNSTVKSLSNINSNEAAVYITDNSIDFCSFLCNNKYYTFFCKKNKKRKGTSFSQNKQLFRRSIRLG